MTAPSALLASIEEKLAKAKIESTAIRERTIQIGTRTSNAGWELVVPDGTDPSGSRAIAWSWREEDVLLYQTLVLAAPEIVRLLRRAEAIEKAARKYREAQRDIGRAGRVHAFNRSESVRNAKQREREARANLDAALSAKDEPGGGKERAK